MDQTCLVLPILPGMTDAARRFLRELGTARTADYDRSQRRLGITKTVWYIASLPSGDHLVAYIEGDDFHRAYGAWIQSRDAFDLWFKERLRAVTGLDLNNPPLDLRLPELVSRYEG